MKLLELMSTNRVAYRLTASDKEGVLKELVQRCFIQDAENLGLKEEDQSGILEVLKERESLGSTGIGDGVAIPHGKFPRLGHLAAGIGIHEGGVDFGALDGNESQFFVVLLAPEDCAGQHLKALARIARLFRDAGFKRRLIDAQTTQELFDLIAQEDARH
ncbi:MAG: PTS fructose transporter subunit IIA [Myxococcales bacterium]|nr:PTS fructose transporter subunit IIA [Myxococcales bacterium]|tara:strand:- start:752 stop:1231 length:480 start_codon:yes stop_codon:yes gene_type:complete